MIRGSGRGLRAAPFLISALGVAVAVATPFFSLRPNRIAQGRPVYLAPSEPILFGLILASWAAFALASFLRGKRAQAVGAGSASLVWVVALLSAASASLSLGGREGTVRLGLGSGFWLSAILAYVAYAVASRDLGGAGKAVCAALPLGLVIALLATGTLSSLAIVREWSAQRDVFGSELRRHLALTGSALAGGCLVGGVFGLFASRHKTLREAGFFVLGTLQTFPSLALFGFLILPLSALSQRYPILRQWGVSGIGPAPALIALTLYACFPIARNVCVALSGVPAAAIDAGRGMGMGRNRLFFKVELPLALPVCLAGLRTAAVQTIGNTAVAALIGAGGLGVFIFQGLGQFAMDMVLLGTLPLVALALGTDALFGLFSRLVSLWDLRGAGAAGSTQEAAA